MTGFRGFSISEDGRTATFSADVFRIEPSAPPDVFPLVVPTGYEPLARILDAALAQAAKGKGRERHAQNGQSFAEQPMLEITGRFGLGFPLGQCAKKTQEAAGMAARGDTDAAKRELLGAIVYLAGAVLALEGGE